MKVDPGNYLGLPGYDFYPNMFSLSMTGNSDRQLGLLEQKAELRNREITRSTRRAPLQPGAGRVGLGVVP